MVGVIPKEDLAGLVPTKPSFGMMTKILRPAVAHFIEPSLFFSLDWIFRHGG